MEFEETPSPPPGILRADHFVEWPGYSCRRRAGTRDWLIFSTCGGEGRFRLGTLAWTSCAGNITILAPGIPHDYAAISSAEPWDFYWAHFLPRSHWSTWMRQLPQANPGVYTLSLAEAPARQRLRQAWERVLRDNRSPEAYREDLALNALEEVLLLVARASAHSALRRLDPRVELVLQQLEHRLSEPPSVTELARLVSLSPSRLAHLFKAQTGDALAATLLKLRLRHAARLLEFTGLAVSEIARQTGFESPFHFSRQFKVYYGISPTGYRAQRAPGSPDE